MKNYIIEWFPTREFRCHEFCARNNKKLYLFGFAWVIFSLTLGILPLIGIGTIGYGMFFNILVNIPVLCFYIYLLFKIKKKYMGNGGSERKMVIFDKSMNLPLKMEEDNDGGSETYGNVQLISSDELLVATVLAESEEYRDEQNIIGTRKDAIYILNAVNNFEDMFKIIKNYQKLLLKVDSKSKYLVEIDNLIKSFKTIDYENGIPYNWNDNDI
jgi:hypothetical protein